MNPQLIQIVPRMNAGEGVFDCATQLARVLGARYGATSRFIEGGRAAGRAHLSKALENAEAGTGLLLHYVGYGYATRGAPLWLARMLEERPMPGPRLGVMFHELYATGRPWQSSFWLGGLQKSVAARIARCGEFALITREASHRWLERTGALAGKPVSVLPIFSNVGEPPDPAPLRRRPATMVVWGSAPARTSLYSRHGVQLGEACRALGITRITDIGAPAAPDVAGGIPVEARGTVTAEELGRVLSSSRCGVVVYPASFLAKSSIFAAYAAHGLVPLLLDKAHTTASDGLVAGRHFLRLSAEGFEPGDASPEEVASQAHAWYSGHTSAVHAEAVWRMLGGRAP